MDAKSVLKFFEEITYIPRESGKEEKMAEYLINFAKERNLEYKKDKVGNVLISKKAAKGKEHIPTLALQSHQDMVCEKLPESKHDFDKDPIKYVIEDGWMIAKETTLGADDGIGVAASLALLDSDMPLGALECLFTTSEETSMGGAMGIEEGFLTAKTLINLDSEEEGELFIGCAGGMDSTMSFDFEREALMKDPVFLKVRVFGAKGGHSGDDINKGRANAIQQLLRLLYRLRSADFQLLNLVGGNKYNAIPRDAEAKICVDASKLDFVQKTVEEMAKNLSVEYAVTDSAISADFSKFEATEEEKKLAAIPAKLALNIISVMLSTQNGVVAMSQDIPDLVETSTHLAFVKTSDKQVVVGTSQRSSLDSAKWAIADKIQAAYEMAGAKVVQSDVYPGWKPNVHSHLLEESIAAYKRCFNQEPKVRAIHAGLECGMFLEKFPYLDMISFGPTLQGPHAPGERLNLESNEKFVKFLVELVSSYK